MTISEQADYTLNHRAFKQAIENYQNGYSDDLRYILVILQREAANKTKDSQNRCYRNWSRLNIADIKHELNINPIPTNLDCRMPIVKRVDTISNKVLKMKIAITDKLDIFEEVA